MKLTLLQTDIVWGDPEANRSRAEALIASQPGADLYVLPEMFTTGIPAECSSRTNAENLGSPSLIVTIAPSPRQP